MIEIHDYVFHWGYQNNNINVLKSDELSILSITLEDKFILSLNLIIAWSLRHLSIDYKDRAQKVDCVKAKFLYKFRNVYVQTYMNG